VPELVLIRNISQPFSPLSVVNVEFNTPATLIMASQRLDISRQETLILPAFEIAPLPGGTPHDRKLWVKIPRYVFHATLATVYCSKANILLVFIPLSVSAASQDWNPVAAFFLSFFAIFPLAELLSWSTEQVSASVGQTLGGLLTATFGNAVELIVSRGCVTLLDH
jgi:hypothetical protein